MKSFSGMVGVLVIVGLVLGGCGSSGTASGKAAKSKESKTETAASNDTAKGSSSTGPELMYQYNPVGKRDPFRSPLLDVAVAQTTGGRTMCPDPLCQWELDQLTLVAVVTGDANPIAMVEDPGGRGHIVRRNTRIGKQDGRVSQILRDAVVVTEYWVGPDGKTKPNPVNLKLKQDVASAPPVDMLTGQPYQ